MRSTGELFRLMTVLGAGLMLAACGAAHPANGAHGADSTHRAGGAQPAAAGRPAAVAGPATEDAVTATTARQARYGNRRRCRGAA